MQQYDLQKLKTFQNTEEFSKLRPTRLTRCHSSLLTSRNPPQREAWGLFPGQPFLLVHVPIFTSTVEVYTGD